MAHFQPARYAQFNLVRVVQFEPKLVVYYVRILHFEQTNIVPICTLELFFRLIPEKYNIPFKRLAYKTEKLIPKLLNLIITRNRLIEYKKQKKLKLKIYLSNLSFLLTKCYLFTIY